MKTRISTVTGPEPTGVPGPCLPGAQAPAATRSLMTRDDPPGCIVTP